MIEETARDLARLGDVERIAVMTLVASGKPSSPGTRTPADALTRASRSANLGRPR